LWDIAGQVGFIITNFQQQNIYRMMIILSHDGDEQFSMYYFNLGTIWIHDKSVL